MFRRLPLAKLARVALNSKNINRTIHVQTNLLKRFNITNNIVVRGLAGNADEVIFYFSYHFFEFSVYLFKNYFNHYSN